MENQAKFKVVLQVAIVVAAGALVWYLFAAGIVGRSPKETLVTLRDRNAEEYKKVLETSPVSSLFGTVTKISPEGNLTIDVPSILGVDIAQGSPRRVRTVAVREGTQIVDRFAKSETQFEKELRIYNEKRPKGAAEPPAPYEYKTISASDLKVGDIIMVEADGGANIKDAPTIYAARITRSNR